MRLGLGEGLSWKPHLGGDLNNEEELVWKARGNSLYKGPEVQDRVGHWTHGWRPERLSTD